ncbi:MAG: hypothetical protein COS76_03170 [Candidatus Portnoybacteria bacterium CG06_land_8_20_14_3_00_39_12]|uniref:TIGR00374 family protein n=1 Tax=Candidatus Portnoybacteria bacterium CG06_land_8_20_14_3_00_39_12 TaxID=1974809 RepID=A0A2M7AWH6_9BACT|nr:MAG: hypothetical protein COS76_03170 [Candidatus Portnoybacteria bacterium CG06_land_8_20_14_3_00_39_12]
MNYSKIAKKNFFSVFSAVIGIVLFIGVIKKVGFKELLSVIGQLSLWQLFFLIILLVLFVFVSVCRWRLLLSMINSGQVSWLNSLKPWIADFAFSYLSPAPSFGGEPLRLRIFKESKGDKVSWAQVAATIFIDKIFDATANLIIVILGVIMLFWQHALSFPLRMMIIIIVTLSLAVIGAGYYRMIRRQGFISTLAKLFHLSKSQLWQKIAGHVDEMEQVVHRFFSFKNPFFLPVIFLTILRMASVVARVYLVILFVSNQQIGLIGVVIILSSTFLIYFLPFPGGLGGFESSQAFLFVLLGLGAQQGLAYALVMRFAEMIPVSLGILVVLQASMKSFLNNLNGGRTP